MKARLVLLLLIAASASFAQTFDYRVFIKGKPAGTVKSTFKSGSFGFIENSVGELSQNGQTIKITTRTEVDAAGNWKKKTLEATANGRTAKAVATPKFDRAIVVIDADGKKMTREIAKATKTTTTDLTMKWFITHTPKVGESAKVQRFDLQRMRWSDVTYRYIGPKSVAIGGKHRAGFQLDRTEADKKTVVILDAKGVPILMDSPDMRMERIYGK
jgi:hypothetical protein